MGAVWLVFGAKLRRCWRSWLLLAVLVAIVSGFVLAAAAAGGRGLAPGASPAPDAFNLRGSSSVRVALYGKEFL